MKRRVRRRRRVAKIAIDLLRSDPDAAMAAARQRGGVNVIDASGDVRFRLVMFSEPLVD